MDLADPAVSPVDPRSGQRGRKKPVAEKVEGLAPITPDGGGGSSSDRELSKSVGDDSELPAEGVARKRNKKSSLGNADDIKGHAPSLEDATGGRDDDLKDAPFMDAVVKVFCVHTEPNFSLPWQRKRQFSSNSSGFIIKGRRVLTNAHSVEHHTQVKVKKRGSDTKYLATVLAIGTECDIGQLLPSA